MLLHGSVKFKSIVLLSLKLICGNQFNKEVELIMSKESSHYLKFDGKNKALPYVSPLTGDTILDKAFVLKSAGGRPRREISPAACDGLEKV